MSEPAAEEYTIGWICALQEEYDTAHRMFDTKFEGPEAADPNDYNTYAFGRIHKHNVVIGCLPSGIYGTTPAACVAKDMVRSFPSLRFALMVGIGGGAPTPERDIRLGDVVVSKPQGELGGVIQYDLGKRLSDGKFKRTGQLNGPPPVLLGALPEVQRRHKDPSERHSLTKSLARMDGRREYSRPASDKLYRADSRHHGGKTCDECDSSSLIERPPRPSDQPIAIHYGTIASGNTVMKDAAERDRYAKDPALNVLCFEMEAAGLMNNFPCLVIRGICDYSDDHKNDEWHNYAALTAAAYARDLLGVVRPQKVAQQPAWAGKVESLLGEVSEEVKEVLHHQRTEEEENLLRWLSPIDHVKTQIDKARCRNPETKSCQWLFESPEFKQFLDENNKNLFCPGIPGAGKTVLASVVVGRLLKLRKGDEGNEHEKVGVAFVYFDFKQQSELVHFLGSILRQLAADHSSAIESIRKLHKECKNESRTLSTFEVRELLHSMAASFSKLYLVVDALDEGQQHVSDGLLSEIFDLQRKCGINIFATSRHIPAIEARFKGASILEVRACDEDIRHYVDNNMNKLPCFVRESPGLREEVKGGIIKAVDGMFLLATFHLNSLVGVRSARALRDALNRLPNPTGTNAYDQAYDLALDRIKGQVPKSRDLAIEVLSWVVCARVHLTIEGLQHALAVIVNSTHFDESNIPDMREVVSVCAGLVVVDQGREIVRLVHYTAQEYFERNQKQRLPDAQSYITTICLSYFSLDHFDSTHYLKGDPFYPYAAMNWGYHARETPVLLPVVLEFLRSKKIDGSAWLLANSAWGYASLPTGVTGLHCAAFFGISEAVKLLMDQDCVDRQKWSPLSWAAFNGQAEVVALLLNTSKVDAESKNLRSRTPLHLAAENGHSDVASLLLTEGGVDVNALDYCNSTPLHLAVKKGHDDAVQTLLNHGADSNVYDNDSTRPLTLAVREGHVTVMRQLLDKNQIGLDSMDDLGDGPIFADAVSAGSMAVVKLLMGEYKVNINSRDKKGRTPLSIALHMGHKNVASLLLADDRVDFVSRDSDGRTPLSYAAEKDNLAAVKFLLSKDGVDINSCDNTGRSALSWLAEASGRYSFLPKTHSGRLAIARLLIESGVKIDSRDNDGRTPLLEAACQLHYLAIDRRRIDLEVLHRDRACHHKRRTDSSFKARLDEERESAISMSKNCRDIFNLLVENGAHTKVTDKYGFSIDYYRDRELEFWAEERRNQDSPCLYCNSWWSSPMDVSVRTECFFSYF
ncbi:hypothetical protein BHE90_001156 [Fusarium euwallaceae]|uniref:Uncharacterized protein n=1 Tax=Fusarium euwallaceae TaxID=1147111 RepID=A0A430M8P0_9HYPO|nr:hypothetical protein BHE90_001156 [Fusarium euwallaceae]